MPASGGTTVGPWVTVRTTTAWPPCPGRQHPHLHTEQPEADKAGRLLTDDSDVNNTTLFLPKAWKNGARVSRPGEGANMFAQQEPDGSRCTSSDRPDGGMDLWYIRRNGTTWEYPPVNMGPKVNSRGDDVFPSMKGNDTLFFASDAQITFGGLDILFSVRDSTGAWGSPMHLDYPLNSQSDDFALTFNPDGKSGLVSSDRFGYDRLFNFNIVSARSSWRASCWTASPEPPFPTRPSTCSMWWTAAPWPSTPI